MWYIAGACLLIVLLVHVYPYVKMYEGAYRVNRGITFLALTALAPGCDNPWIFGGHAAFCANLFMFSPVFVRAHWKKQKTWALLLVVILEVMSSLYLFVVLCIWNQHVGPFAGLLLTSSALQIVWYNEVEFEEDSYLSLG